MVRKGVKREANHKPHTPQKKWPVWRLDSRHVWLGGQWTPRRRFEQAWSPCKRLGGDATAESVRMKTTMVFLSWMRDPKECSLPSASKTRAEAAFARVSALGRAGCTDDMADSENGSDRGKGCRGQPNERTRGALRN